MGGMVLYAKTTYTLQFADDQDKDDLIYEARKLDEEYSKWGLKMNLIKTKYLCPHTKKLRISNQRTTKLYDHVKRTWLNKKSQKIEDEDEIRNRLEWDAVVQRYN